jgi:hypothetical protein
MVVNAPDVVAEVTAAFAAYETALVANDVDALDGWFWDDDRVVRFAFGDVQLGAAAISAARRALPRQTGPRAVEHLTVNAFGQDAANVFAVFRLQETGGLVHQSQTWARLGGGWRVVAAHVSAP